MRNKTGRMIIALLIAVCIPMVALSLTSYVPAALSDVYLIAVAAIELLYLGAVLVGYMR
jgi:hypothetical protein